MAGQPSGNYNKLGGKVHGFGLLTIHLFTSQSICMALCTLALCSCKYCQTWFASLLCLWDAMASNKNLFLSCRNYVDWLSYLSLLAAFTSHVVDVFDHSETLARWHARYATVGE